jgi:hypothetical protein
LGDVIQFTGQIQVVLEAGSRIYFNGVTLRMNDQCCLVAEPYEKSQEIFDANAHFLPHDPTLNPLATTPAAVQHNQYAPLSPFGNGLLNTDPFRVRLIGIGIIELAGTSCFLIPDQSYVGIETLFEFSGQMLCEIPETNLQITLLDSSSMLIGDAAIPGGSLQIGNVSPHEGHSVSFILSFVGKDAKFVINRGGFVGFGVGIVDKRHQFNPLTRELTKIVPNDWAVDTTFNVTAINIGFNNGLLQHAQTFQGEDVALNDGEGDNASLLAFGKYTTSTPQYFLALEDFSTTALARSTDMAINGGGNMVIISQAIPEQNGFGALHPVVLMQDNQVTVAPGVVHPRMRVGLLTSRPMMVNGDVNGGPDFVFDTLKLQDWRTVGVAQNRGTAAFKTDPFATVSDLLRVAIVDVGTIGRNDIFDTADADGGTPQDRRQQAAKTGAVSITTMPGGATGQIIFTQQLPE